MQKKTKKINKAYEFMTLITMVMGMMIGSGIYIKNHSGVGGILGNAGNNPWIAIMMWSIFGVIATMIILVFIEVASSTKNKGHSTLQNWGSKFLGRKAGSFFSLFLVIFFTPVLTCVGAFLSVKVVFDGIDALYGKEWAGETLRLTLRTLFTLIVLLGFMVMNIFTTKPGVIVQTVTALLKFVPLILVIIGGIILRSQGNENAFTNSSGKWEISHIILTITPIMFSFMGFIESASLQKDIKNKEVVAPALFCGVIGVSLFYVLISIAIFFGSKNGNVFTLFDNLFEKAPGWAMFFKVIVAITATSVVNGYAITGTKGILSSFEDDLFYAKQGFKVSLVKAGILQSAITLFHAIIYIILGWIFYKDIIQVVDLISNTVAIATFTIYLLIIFGVIRNRFTNKVQVDKVKYLFGIAAFPSIALSLSLVYIYYDLFSKLGDAKGFIEPVIFIVTMIALIGLFFYNELKIKQIGTLNFPVLTQSISK
ncbi:APC family permease [Mesoplasma seiffertii]|uniref:APC family permease n=1 Tax=Mesoplasma seiffertii TaxID=28224 RepID=UPI000478A593|nr:amino acid permease [Mesoplasma seiffertii]